MVTRLSGASPRRRASEPDGGGGAPSDSQAAYRHRVGRGSGTVCDQFRLPSRTQWRRGQFGYARIVSCGDRC